LSEEFSIHWLEETIERILEKKPSQITLSTGKTPSGHIHIGILREIIICDALRRIFEEKGKNVKFYLFMDDFDAAKRFPDYIDEKFAEKNLGKPFVLIPCPFTDCGCKSYAEHFGNELISTFSDFGIKNEIIWSFELYQKKEMQEKIKLALINVNTIKKILKKFILPTLNEERKQEFIEMQINWMPVMVLCENCNKLQNRNADGSITPNRVLSYIKETEEVTYECPACNNKGKVSLYSGRLKLNWRIDWPAKWAIFNTTCEPAGKDHSVKGGAYDTGLDICKKIFNYDGPVKLPYEWLRLGVQDMKTSKGIVLTPKTYLELADPEIYRMLIIRTNPMKHISLRLEEMPQYHDYFERMEVIFYNNDKAESEQELEFYKYIYPLTKINELPEAKPIKVPFKFLNYFTQLQNIISIEKIYEKAIQVTDIKEKDLPFEEFKFLLKRTENWLNEIKEILNKVEDTKKKKSILKKIDVFSIPERVDNLTVNNLDDNQLRGISIFRDFIINNQSLEPDTIQNKIFSIAKKELKIAPKKMFEAFYLILLGKFSGPRLGPFIIMLDREWLLQRLNQILD